MIKRLQRRFVLTAMFSLFIVLLIFVGSINIFNYRIAVNDADRLLGIVSRYNGRLPKQNEVDNRDEMPNYNSPEEPYEYRYFSVLLDANGALITSNTEDIAAIDSSTALNYARDALDSGKVRGFAGDYRFIVVTGSDGIRCSFVDWSRRLDICRIFFFSSLWISFAVMVAVLVLLTLVSGRVMKPIAESYEKQKRFITDAGHEIKTPLTIIDADASLIEMENGENKWVSDIQMQVKRLSDLTNDLIYLSRMDETDNKLSMIDFPLSDTVEEEARSFEGLAQQSGKHFSYEIEPMLSLKGDEHSIRRLVSILLDNAVKYCPTGGDISLSLSKKGHNVSLRVFNTADSISKKDIPRLFDRFYRADSSRNFATGSSGIGLSIANAIVGAHKGKISASSKDGKSLLIIVLLTD